jgi:hypothetical protein
VQRNPKITPDDYPDLLAAVDEGVSERELARRYDCAHSLIHRHVARARQAQDLSDVNLKPESGAVDDVLTGSLREILQSRMRDPNTSSRDLASLTNALARLKDENQGASYPSLKDLRLGTLIVEPGPASEFGRRFRVLWRVPGGIRHVSEADYTLTAAEALHLVLCGLGQELGLTPEALGFTPEEIAAAAATPGY